MNERNKEKQKELKRETQNKRNNKEPEEGTPAHKSALKTQYVFMIKKKEIPTYTNYY